MLRINVSEWNLWPRSQEKNFFLSTVFQDHDPGYQQGKLFCFHYHPQLFSTFPHHLNLDLVPASPYGPQNSKEFHSYQLLSTHLLRNAYNLHNTISQNFQWQIDPHNLMTTSRNTITHLSYLLSLSSLQRFKYKMFNHFSYTFKKIGIPAI